MDCTATAPIPSLWKRGRDMKRLILWSLLLAALYGMVPRCAIAQNYPGQNSQNTIRCSSDDGDRHHCAANVRAGVQLSRQISGSPCVRNRSWGTDQNGIWVDKGCRAEFVTGNAYSGNGQTVRCNSDDGDRHYCNASVSGGVQLSRQISGSPCVQGQTWGYDQRGIWVDKGCRAEFLVGGGGDNNNGGNYNGGNYNGNGQMVRCNSDDEDRHYCNANVSGGVQLSRQISGSPCVQGQTWGYDQRGIWVDKGCRAEFLVGSGGNGGSGNNGGQQVNCSSDDEKLHRCDIGQHGYVRMTRQLSGSPCVRDRTWGVDDTSIWVDRGCRATFSVQR